MSSTVGQATDFATVLGSSSVAAAYGISAAGAKSSRTLVRLVAAVAHLS